MSRTIKQATDQVLEITRQKLATAWRDNTRRTFEKIASAGFMPSGTAAMFKVAKAHEQTICDTAKNVEQQIRRILEVYPFDQVKRHEAELRSTFSTFISECFDTARKQVTSDDHRSSTFDRSAIVRATTEWATLQRELIGNFDLMIMEAKKAAAATNPASVIYNVSGPGARVNVNSTDNSTNVITVNRGELFERLRRDIETKVPAEQRSPILEQVAQMEKADSKPAMLGAYSEWVRLVASHASIITAYVPAITQLLSSM